MSAPEAPASPATIDWTRADLVMRVRSGSEHNPGDPWGQVDITLRPDAVEVTNRHRGTARQWRARPRPELLARLRELLSAAGFPTQPPLVSPPAGAAMYALRVETGGAGATVMVPEPSFAALPAWRAIFELCDAVARQTSRGALTVGRDCEPPWVDPVD